MIRPDLARQRQTGGEADSGSQHQRFLAVNQFILVFSQLQITAGILVVSF